MQFMRLKEENLKELKQIIHRDYGVVLNDEDADQLGFSLLKITCLAMGAFNRMEENRLMAIMS